MLKRPFPAISAPPLRPAVPRSLCTDCGLSRSTNPKACGTACQFIRPDYPGLETQVHGRPRNPETDELFFGPTQSTHRAALLKPREGAQWTGITTRIAERLLEAGAVDGVLTVRPSATDRWAPEPVIVTDPARMADCRGMRMGYAPTLALLEPARAMGLRRIALIGIPCQVYALRALEKELGFERILVIGTPCSDNTTTANFHRFLALLDPNPETITYLEFRADFRVELRYADGRKRLVPFLKLPISKLPPDFFPMTCRTCVDYTNALADITVGYMGGTGEQWLLVRNARGREMLDLIVPELRLKKPDDRGRRKGPVTGFLQNTERAAGGLPLRAMPDWLRPLMGWLMPRIGPKGLEFARARVEMKAIETVLHLRRAHPRRMKAMIPAHVWRLVAPYAITPRPGETSPTTGAK
jgi:coenzyme F420 hydrogenase subunit beta